MLNWIVRSRTVWHLSVCIYNIGLQIIGVCVSACACVCVCVWVKIGFGIK